MYCKIVLDCIQTKTKFSENDETRKKKRLKEAVKISWKKAK